MGARSSSGRPPTVSRSQVAPACRQRAAHSLASLPVKRLIVVNPPCRKETPQGRALTLTVRRPAGAAAPTLVGVADEAPIVYPDIAVCSGVVQALGSLLLPVAPGAAAAG